MRDIQKFFLILWSPIFILAVIMISITDVSLEIKLFRYVFVFVSTAIIYGMIGFGEKTDELEKMHRGEKK